MEKTNLIILTIVILIAIAGAFYFMNQGGEEITPQSLESAQQTQTPEESQTQSETQTQQEQQVKEFTMTAKKYEFEPSTITVNQGDLVKISIQSTDVTHGFSLPEFNINERLEPNQDVNIEFIADKTGEFIFFCSVFCGSGHGEMKGALIVE